ncbi:hypothetical protein PoB_007485400 [Plakobranchus ocellatus]|uniref:Uncharacterized protein n=1 Tax=Plakobranchus ocellatus TaxID=259542 RepID=A0AAV4DW76_9GAST|nr:hypothetical protein PoB_007485400 [Plakobranchus ocellatus]
MDLVKLSTNHLARTLRHLRTKPRDMDPTKPGKLAATNRHLPDMRLGGKIARTSEGKIGVSMRHCCGLKLPAYGLVACQLPLPLASTKSCQ